MVEHLRIVSFLFYSGPKSFLSFKILFLILTKNQSKDPEKTFFSTALDSWNQEPVGKNLNLKPPKKLITKILGSLEISPTTLSCSSLGREQPDEKDNMRNGYHPERECILREIGGISVRTPKDRKGRFESNVLHAHERIDPQIRTDMADKPPQFWVHSLRAVDPRVIALFVQSDADRGPIHLHVAEQRREVNNAVLHLQKRPAEWLFENWPIGHQLHLVHATHMTRAEAQALGASAATVVPCPST